MKPAFSLVLPILFFLLGCQNQKHEIENPENQWVRQKSQWVYQAGYEGDLKKLYPLLKAKRKEDRVLALQGFAQIQNPDVLEQLKIALITDGESEVRKMAAFAIGQLRSPQALPVLRQALANEMHLPNRTFILEAMGKCSSTETTKLLAQITTNNFHVRLGQVKGIYRALSNKHVTPGGDSICAELLNHDSLVVQRYAAHYLLRKTRIAPIHQTVLKNLKTDSRSPEIKAVLSRILAQPMDQEMKPISDGPEIKKLAMENPYALASYFKHHRIHSEADFELVFNLLKNTKNTFGQTALATEIEKNAQKTALPEFISYCLENGDMALVSLACYAIQKGGFSIDENWQNVLLAQKKNLELPRQLETFIDIEKTIAHLKGTDYRSSYTPSTKPLNWKFIQTIPANQRVLIRTNKGDITLQLHVNEAPGSVANFLELVDSGFYANKRFHRVVEDFVIQGGCPRGDGWGSLNWCQSSEFHPDLLYTPGAVGLASAGKNTEGVQWFITHTSTPHLEGRYSVFAHVISGMNVVNQIQVGDTILEIKRV